MSNVQKALFDVSGSQVHIGFDFQKANGNTERTVVGFATLDNIDQTGELVTAAASAEAFRTFRGNIRTQHNKYNPVAVMKAFEPAEYVNPQTGEVHKGIRMAVKVADDDAWNKIVEGVYSGFSVGGIITGSHEEWNKELGRSVKIITEYKLTEISLVDNPANELANFETVYKALGFNEDDSLQKDFNEKNLFFCPRHNLTAKSSESRFTCGECGENMAKVGTINENEDITEKIVKVLDELEIDMKGVTPTMADEINKDAEGADEVKAEDVNTEAETANDEVEAQAETEAEAKEAEVDYDAKFDAITAQIQSLQEALLTKVNDVDNSVQDKIAKALESKDGEIAELKKSLEATSGRVESIANATAMRKSEDTTQEQELLEKSNEEPKNIWDGVFSGGYNL